MSPYTFIVVLSFLSFSYSFGQGKGEFNSPLNIPLSLSGNFGELRATHFHAGLDFRTQGVTGKPVFAAAKGYVSRIKIQSGGYGHSLYITHPNGYTTVYAHLDQYIPEIEDYVLIHQYEKKSFEIELFPGSERFVFEKGQLIGYSGNTGSSGGPHLHFEIRKSLGQIPVNGLLFGFPVEDNKAPEFRNLYVYSYISGEPFSMFGRERKIYPVRSMNNKYVIDGVIECADSYIGFGAEVYDFLNGSSNRCGVYIMQLIIDGVPMFMFQIDAVSFGNSRYVNAHMDYEMKIQENRSVHRLFLLPNNKLPIYSSPNGNGLFYLLNDSIHVCEIKALDAYGNSSSLEFRVKRKSDIPVPFVEPFEGQIFKWSDGGSFSRGNYSIKIPPKALYQDAIINSYISNGTGNPLTDTLVISSSGGPTHVGFTLSARLDGDFEKYHDKYFFVRVDNKKLVSEGGDYKQGEIHVTTRNFGKYIILADTVPPELTSVNLKSKQSYPAGHKLNFKVKDDLTGISSYEAYIDDKWALLEYDAKTGTLTYAVDPSRLSKAQSHKIRITVTDGRNNKTIYNGQFQHEESTH